jgi:site-specific recombinase XerD
MIFEVRMNKLTFWLSALLLGMATSTVASEQDELEKMQQQLNQEVLSQEFLAEEPEKVEAYIKEAMEKNLKPEEYTGTYWRRGYTCRDLLRYSWHEYRNCMYYYRYHGRYYPYP